MYLVQLNRIPLDPEATQTFFPSSLGVAVGDGVGLGDGELNKSSSSLSKSPEDFSRVGLDS